MYTSWTGSPADSRTLIEVALKSEDERAERSEGTFVAAKLQFYT